MGSAHFAVLVLSQFDFTRNVITSPVCPEEEGVELVSLCLQAANDA